MSEIGRDSSFTPKPPYSETSDTRPPEGNQKGGTAPKTADSSATSSTSEQQQKIEEPILKTIPPVSEEAVSQELSEKGIEREEKNSTLLNSISKATTNEDGNVIDNEEESIGHLASILIDAQEVVLSHAALMASTILSEDEDLIEEDEDDEEEDSEEEEEEKK